jgi:hypothetical protein
VKATPVVKSKLEELKAKHKLKNESEVISYLLTIYEDVFPKMTVLKHDEYIKTAKENNYQGILL